MIVCGVRAAAGVGANPQMKGKGLTRARTPPIIKRYRAHIIINVSIWG